MRKVPHTEWGIRLVFIAIVAVWCGALVAFIVALFVNGAAK